jgi:hypothetical protein
MKSVNKLSKGASSKNQFESIMATVYVMYSKDWTEFSRKLHFIWYS